jgi:hypothetical protein
MLVRSYGFSVTAGNAEVSLDDLFTSLVATSGDEDTSQRNVRRIFVDTATNKDFALGLVVTVKDQKTFCELVNAKGNFVIAVSNLKGKNKLMEFNFFVINKNNGLGIYQHYFQSCSPGTFSSYLRTRYRRLSETSRDDAIAALKTKGQHTAGKEKAIKAAHAKGLSFGLLVHQESLEAVLSKFKEIKGFEYEFAVVEPDLVKGAPISNFVKRLRQKVSFKPNIDVGALSKAIQGTVDALHPKSGHVAVVDHVDNEDVPMSVRIADIPEHFGEQDYDAVAGKLNNLDTSKFATHVVVNELLAACSDTFKHVFMKKVKDK